MMLQSESDNAHVQRYQSTISHLQQLPIYQRTPEHQRGWLDRYFALLARQILVLADAAPTFSHLPEPTQPRS